MEEPELTLVSTSDISIAEMDFANLTLEEKNEGESLQVNISLNISILHLCSKPIAESWETEEDTGFSLLFFHVISITINYLQTNFLPHILV